MALKHAEAVHQAKSAGLLPMDFPSAYRALWSVGKARADGLTIVLNVNSIDAFGVV